MRKCMVKVFSLAWVCYHSTIATYSDISGMEEKGNRIIKVELIDAKC